MNRKPTIDLLRGFIMMLMALDHAKIFIARKGATEAWGIDFPEYEGISWWFTRFITHLCAPGFFFLMGMSMVLFAESRLQKSWSRKQIIQYFWKRGGIILLCMFFVEFPAWGFGMMGGVAKSTSGSSLPGAGIEQLFFPSTVLYGLSICMIIGGIFYFFKKWQLLLVTILSFAFSGWYISLANPIAAFHPLEHLLFVPGQSSGTMVLYPLIPWLGITTFGMFWARLMREKGEAIYSISLKVGLLFLMIFSVLRFLEWGNFQRNNFDDFISFFTFIKYPPSVIFALFTCGINLILFFLFSKVQLKGLFKPVLLFGQTAMFFYLAHLFIYGIIGWAFPIGASVLVLYPLWLLGLVPLFYLCRWFLKFKNGKSVDSVWRMI